MLNSKDNTNWKIDNLDHSNLDWVKLKVWEDQSEVWMKELISLLSKINIWLQNLDLPKKNLDNLHSKVVDLLMNLLSSKTKLKDYLKKTKNYQETLEKGKKN